jgi:hypothetical protein
MTSAARRTLMDKGGAIAHRVPTETGGGSF